MLLQYGFVGHWFSPGKPTVGALDFGGASTQITFVTQDEVEDKHDMMKLRLYGRDYSLYTHSFLCYGRDQVLKRLLAHILKVEDTIQTTNTKEILIYDPVWAVKHSSHDTNKIFGLILIQMSHSLLG